jgi:uncharacterized protein YxeA
MTIAIEIIAVIAAFMILVMVGVSMVRSIIGLGRTAKLVQSHTQPKIMALMTQSETAQQRVFSITGNADLFLRKSETMKISLKRMMVVIHAFTGASEKLSLAIRKLGF